MSRRKVACLLFVGIVIIAVSALCVRVFSQAGQFTTVKNLRTGTCQAYDGILAPEDIVIDHKAQVAYISSLDRAGVHSQNPASPPLRGAIRMLDLANIKPGAALEFKDITPAVPEHFHPLGISLFTDNEGITRIFVINQAGAKNASVEIFRVVSDRLEHEKSVDLGADVIFANDVLAVGPDRFYVTDSGYSRNVSWLLNFAFQRQRSKTFYVDGGKVTPVVTDLVMANGIAASKDGQEVYVLDTSARSLRFFKRNDTTGALVSTGMLFIGTGVDNIDVAQDGSMWIAAHPKLIDFALYRAGWKKTSSSQIIHAVPGKVGGGDVRTVFLDLGNDLSGASVAVAYKDSFMIGSALDNKLVICTHK